MAYTGWGSRWNSVKDYRNADDKGIMHFPGYSLDAAKFLVEARTALGLGIDTLSIDYGPSKDSLFINTPCPTAFIIWKTSPTSIAHRQMAPSSWLLP